MTESPQPTSEHSERLDTSSRTYFFDVRRSREGKPYLTLKETYSRKGERHEAVLSVWPEDAEAFKAKLLEMLTHLS